MSHSLTAPLWLWWTNPLQKIHPDQERALHSLLELSRDLQYEDVAAMRVALGLEVIPEQDVMSGKRYGLLGLASMKELVLHRPHLAMLTLDESVLQVGPAEWEKLFGIGEKEKIRELIVYRQKLPRNLHDFQKALVKACGDWRSKSSLSLSLRLQIVLSLFLNCRFPQLYRRWELGISDEIRCVIDDLLEQEDGEMRAFCDFAEEELLSLVEKVRSLYEVPEIDFDNLPQERD